MRIFLLSLLIVMAIPALALAAGPHEGLDCTGCHGIHTAQGDIIFAVTPNTEAINPATGKPNTGVTALCLGCHSETGGMGILPVVGKKSHPFGVTPNAKVASVPAELLREGKLECVGCHDPHPSNPNYKYLRVSTGGGAKMESFCNLCHASKSGRQASPSDIFSSMDERK